MTFKEHQPGDLVKLRNPDSPHNDKSLVVLVKLKAEEDDDYSQTGPNYLLRTHEQRKLTAYACELVSIAESPKP
jgi:hypothetical protein